MTELQDYLALCLGKLVSILPSHCIIRPSVGYLASLNEKI